VKSIAEGRREFNLYSRLAFKYYEKATGKVKKNVFNTSQEKYTK
jgi:hypothetical protein